MAAVVKHIEIDGKTYPIVASSNALFMLEEKTGLSTERIGLMLVSGRAGYRYMQYILWALMEAGRMREKTRRDAFTLEEVGDLLDTVGGAGLVWAEPHDGTEEKEVDGVKTKVKVREPRLAHPIYTALSETWKAAFPEARPVEPEPAAPNA